MHTAPGKLALTNPSLALKPSGRYSKTVYGDGYGDVVMVRKQDPAGVRERLLGAAVQTVREGGGNALTLDAVAKTAGVSKGGLLYHFPAKEVLITALMEHLFDRFNALAEQVYADEPPGRGRWLRAYVRATFADEPPALDTVLALATLIDEQPALMARIRESYADWDGRFEAEGMSPARARAVRGSADSYWTDLMLGLAPESAERRRAWLDELLRWIDAPDTGDTEATS